MPAPIWTDGPSRPMECPEPTQSTPVMNFPIGIRAGITPPFRWKAVLVWGTPLPRTSGKNFESSIPVPILITAGTRKRRVFDGVAPKKRWLAPSMASEKSTADSPAMMPITIDSTRNSWFSLSRICGSAKRFMALPGRDAAR